ncbi:MAG TPA: Dyp-type peroxidase, partial [Stellaceae bacterium]|nr:Dyp-type peroxidase [Stellaceae bacterium]
MIDRPRPTRRGLIRAATGLAAAAGTGLTSPKIAEAASGDCPDEASQIEPFWGAHQAGITTVPVQRHSYAATFDAVAKSRDEVVAMLRRWAAAAARMAGGEPAQALGNDAAIRAGDSGEALGLAPARLTVTFGFGTGLFSKDGVDRYGLAGRRPPALVDLPRFDGDELIEALTGGDLSVQACADDPQIAFHAVRQLGALARGAAEPRWAQTGFVSVGAGPQQRPRNLMGFRDGIGNPSVHDPAAMDQFVWVGDEGPDWMRGGSYVVMRRIRVALEHWDRMPLGFQEQTFGRQKYSGAALGSKDELDPPDLNAIGEDGDPVIPENAHIRLARAASNDGAKILRRPYSYNDGINEVTERWEPWRRRKEYDAGLFFVCYQRDPRSGFIKIFER